MVRVRYLSENQVAIDQQVFPLSDVQAKIQSVLTPSRMERIKQVVAGRTRNFVPVLENVHDMGNISAVMRSAESMGFLDFHILEYANRKFKAANRVTNGCEKWLNIDQHSRPADCVRTLKAKGLQVLSTRLSPTAISIFDVDFSKPTALVLGNEKDGVSAELAQLSDADVIIPMLGFSQSFNISVAAALGFFYAMQSRVTKFGQNGDLSTAERLELEIDYAIRTSPTIVQMLSATESQIYF